MPPAGLLVLASAGKTLERHRTRHFAALQLEAEEEIGGSPPEGSQWRERSLRGIPLGRIILPLQMRMSEWVKASWLRASGLCPLCSEHCG
mmetsp:Transcript_65865/g.157433  ORF Transcript_65865/g.157433 Transcript_65865/m.157433 type:complete len:90 (+) Transcript_65865:1909-2178(+)